MTDAARKKPEKKSDRIPTIEEYAAKLAAEAPPLNDAQRVELFNIFSSAA